MRAKVQQIRFIVQAVGDVLPSLSNVHVWTKMGTPACPLSKHGASVQVFGWMEA